MERRGIFSASIHMLQWLTRGHLVEWVSEEARDNAYYNEALRLLVNRELDPHSHNPDQAQHTPPSSPAANHCTNPTHKADQHRATLGRQLGPECPASDHHPSVVMTTALLEPFISLLSGRNLSSPCSNFLRFFASRRPTPSYYRVTQK